MNLIYYFIFGMIGFFVFLLVFYSLDNPLNRSISNVVYPYILSIKPPIIDTDGSINIASYLIDASNKKSKVLVAGPYASVFEANSSKNMANLVFPDDFIGGPSPLQTGNYTVLLISTSTHQTITSLPFNVVLSPFVYSLSNFAFTSGLPITLALVASAVTTVYQIISQQNTDRKRRLEDKAKWITSNWKYYYNMAGPELDICSLFKEDVKLESKDRMQLLYNIMKFYEEFNKFRDNTNVYYFDDVYSEDFLNKISTEILRMLYAIIDDPNHLKKFFKLEYFELRTNMEFQVYSDKAYAWLSEETKDGLTNAMRFYFCHLVHSWILSICINEASLVTYSTPSKIVKMLRYEIKKVKDLEKAIQTLNKLFYNDNKERYYRLRINNKDLLKEPKNKFRLKDLELILLAIIVIIFVLIMSHYFLAHK